MKGLAWRAAGLAAWTLLVAGCAQQATEGAALPAGKKLQINQAVWSQYEEYVREGRELGPDRQGAFGVLVVGDLGLYGLSSYNYCPRMYDRCGPGRETPTSRILSACRRENVECLIFARNESILVPYEIVD